MRRRAKRNYDKRRREEQRLERERAAAVTGDCKRCAGMPWRRDWPRCPVCDKPHMIERVKVEVPSGGQWWWAR